MTECPYQTLGSRIVWENKWYRLRSDDVRFPDGVEGVYTVVERGEAVFIVPVLPDGRLVVLRNYRYTVGKWLWEVPAGGLENGISPLEMARRELKEEAGGSAALIKPIGAFYTAPGISDEKSWVFLAHDVTLGTPHRESSEVMEVHALPIDEVLALIHSGDMQDGPSALSVLLALPHLTRSS